MILGWSPSQVLNISIPCRILVAIETERRKLYKNKIVMEITLLIMEKSWKNHGIVFLNFCGNPESYAISTNSCFSQLLSSHISHTLYIPGRIAQSVRCLATDVCLTAYPGVLSSIPAQSHTFMEHEILSIVILLPPAESFKKGWCQLQVKVCSGSTG